MRNAEIADHFDELADLYELDGAVVHRVLAYRTAAKSVREAARSVAELSRAGRVEELPGIGRTLAEKITALLETGTIPAAERLKATYPTGLIAVTHLPGFGPKKARRVFDELGVTSLEELRAAAESGRLRGVPGFGPKAETGVLAALEAAAEAPARRRTLLPRARAAGDEIVAGLRAHPAAEQVELAGSARRGAETCKDLDVVVASREPGGVVAAFRDLEIVGEVTSAGEAGARAVTHSGMPVDLRIVSPESFGSLLQHLTGSGRHNEALRTEAVRRGLSVSEYGIVEEEGGERHGCATEDEVYRRLGLAAIAPELREDRGELRAAREGRLPELVRVEDLRGDLHAHTVASDGRNTVEEMAAAARARGLEYLAVTDHSASHGFNNHLDADTLRRHAEHVRAVDAGLEGFRVLAGSEVNILPDGSLDYDDELLAELDWVVASVHTSFRQTETEMTERVIRALEHPLVDALGHPTGRLIERREPYPLDLGAVVEAAVRTGTFLEINANPDRRDLHETNARHAMESGALLVIDSDAHGIERLGNVAYGVLTARRGWVTAERVANTRPWAEVERLRKGGRAAKGG